MDENSWNIPDVPLRKPERRLVAALMSLMSEKPFSQITVSEVCTRAGMRRPAFYNYYPGIAQLLDAARSYLFDTFDECFGGPLLQPPIFSDENMRRYFQMIRERPQPLLMLVNNWDLLVTEEVLMTYEGKAAHAFDESGIAKEAQRSYLLTYFLTGFVRGVAAKWAKGGFVESVDDMVMIARECLSINSKDE